MISLNDFIIFLDFDYFKRMSRRRWISNFCRMFIDEWECWVKYLFIFYIYYI